MAEQTASDTTKKAAPTKPKYVEGTVVIQTNTFDPLQPVLLDQAASVFTEQVKGVHGEGTKLTNVVASLAVHKVGETVTYNVTGEVAG